MILDRIRAMTRDDWLRELAWRPEGAEETYRTREVDEDVTETPVVVEAIRRGRDDVAGGSTQPASEAFEELRQEFDIPRDLG